MYRLTSKLIVYRSIDKQSILYQLSEICHEFDQGHYEKEDLRGRILDEINRLLELSTKYGFDHNLWHNYLAYLLASTEVPFSLVSEKVGANEGSVNLFAKNDLHVFKTNIFSVILVWNNCYKPLKHAYIQYKHFL